MPFFTGICQLAQVLISQTAYHATEDYRSVPAAYCSSSDADWHDIAAFQASCHI